MSQSPINLHVPPQHSLNKIRKHHSSIARLYSARFIYLCEAHKVFFFSQSYFHAYFSECILLEELSHSKNIQKKTKTLCKKVYQHIVSIDTYIEHASENWHLYRMNAIDRAILRLGCYEITQTSLSRSIIIHEALQVAEIFGAEKSKPFIHGVLDTITPESITEHVIT